MKSIKRLVLGIAFVIAFAYALNIQYVGELLNIIGNAAIECVKGGDEYSTQLKEEMDTLSVSKFIDFGFVDKEFASHHGFSHEEIENLKITVINEGQRLKDIGYTNKQLGPAVAGAYDRTTGKIYTAINDYEGAPPKELSPMLEERIYDMPQEIRDSYVRTKGAGSHAEIYAVNQLLLNNPNVNASDIAVYVNRTLGTSKHVIEIPFETCPHCRYILEGFYIVSNE